MRYCVGTNHDFLRPTLAQNTESMMGAQRIFRINHIDKMTRKDEVWKEQLKITFRENEYAEKLKIACSS